MTRVLTELVGLFPTPAPVQKGAVFEADYNCFFGGKRDYIGRVCTVGMFSFTARVIIEFPPTRKFDRRNYVKRFWFNRVLRYHQYQIAES
jgi:hypothetical protein